MGRKLKNYVLYLEALLADKSKIEDIEKLKHDVLLEIGFWQHERLIHLLVTILFSLLLMSMIIVSFFYVTMQSLVLLALLLCLEVPYIRHYYILENNTQKLYRIYEQLADVGGCDITNKNQK